MAYLPLRVEGSDWVDNWASGRFAGGGNAYPILEVGFFGSSSLPFNQYVWNNPTVPTQQNYSWAISSIPPAATVTVLPFNTYYWPNPQIPSQTNRSYIWTTIPPAVAPTVLPFNQYLWPLPTIPAQPDRSYIWTTIPPAAVPTQLPFNQYSWPLPQLVAQPDRFYVQSPVPPANLFPFNTYSWPITPPKYSDGFYSQNLLTTTLYTPPGPLPNNQYDWPLPRTSPRADQSWLTNLATLFAPPPPPPAITLGGRQREPIETSVWPLTDPWRVSQYRTAASMLGQLGGIASGKARKR
jgi:hypothetical protein